MPLDRRSRTRRTHTCRRRYWPRRQSWWRSSRCTHAGCTCKQRAPSRANQSSRSQSRWCSHRRGRRSRRAIAPARRRRGSWSPACPCSLAPCTHTSSARAGRRRRRSWTLRDRDSQPQAGDGEPGALARSPPPPSRRGVDESWRMCHRRRWPADCSWLPSACLCSLHRSMSRRPHCTRSCNCWLEDRCSRQRVARTSHCRPWPKHHNSDGCYPCSPRTGTARCRGWRAHSSYWRQAACTPR